MKCSVAEEQVAQQQNEGPYLVVSKEVRANASVRRGEKAFEVAEE